MSDIAFEKAVFVSAAGRRNFFLAAVSTFLAFSTYSQLAMLAVVLRRTGMSDRSIGLLLSSPLPVVLVVMLVSGRLIGRYGSAPTMKAGLYVMSLAYLSLHLTTREPYLSCISLMAFSIGYGIFMPATMAYAGTQLTSERRAYYFGIYTSMIPLPTVLGPPIAEALLRVVGPSWFFVVSAVPALLGASIATVVTSATGDCSAEQRAAWRQYLELLVDLRVRGPYLGIVIVGVVYGFAVSFMGLLLVTYGVPVFYFFTSYMICFMMSRFLLLKYLAQVARYRLVAAGIVGMSLAYALLGYEITSSAAFAAGLLFGLGYSVCFPTLIGEVVDHYEESKRGMPIALFNALFAMSSYALPAAGGYVIATAGPKFLIGLLAVFGLVAAVIFAAISAKLVRRQAIAHMPDAR
jgi:MFS family permease